MGFEVFTRSSAPAPHVPAVTIQRRGLFSLNQAAFDMLGAPDAVEFLWDSDNQLIGLRPTDPGDLNGYATRHQGPNNTGPVLIAGTLFTRHIGLDTTTARRWTPTLTDDHILVIDLTTPGAPVTSNRNQRPAPSPTPVEDPEDGPFRMGLDDTEDDIDAPGGHAHP